MNKALIGVVVFIALAGGLLAFTFLGGEEASAPATSGVNEDAAIVEPEQEALPDANTTPDEQILTEAEVATRNTAEECWTIINDSVYDITDYIPRHPGGDQILQACGTDGTSLFTERTTDNGEQIGSGTPHSSGAAAQLESFKLGDLAS